MSTKGLSAWFVTLVVVLAATLCSRPPDARAQQGTPAGDGRRPYVPGML